MVPNWYLFGQLRGAKDAVSRFLYNEYKLNDITPNLTGSQTVQRAPDGSSLFGWWRFTFVTSGLHSGFSMYLLDRIWVTYVFVRWSLIYVSVRWGLCSLSTYFLPPGTKRVTVPLWVVLACFRATGPSLLPHGIAEWLERRTRDWKIPGTCRSGGRIFFSRVNWLCWLLFQYPFHPRVERSTQKMPVILPEAQMAAYS